MDTTDVVDWNACKSGYQGSACLLSIESWMIVVGSLGSFVVLCVVYV